MTRRRYRTVIGRKVKHCIHEEPESPPGNKLLEPKAGPPPGYETEGRGNIRTAEGWFNPITLREASSRVPVR